MENQWTDAFLSFPDEGEARKQQKAQDNEATPVFLDTEELPAEMGFAFPTIVNPLKDLSVEQIDNGKCMLLLPQGQASLELQSLDPMYPPEFPAMDAWSSGYSSPDSSCSEQYQYSPTFHYYNNQTQQYPPPYQSQATHNHPYFQTIYAPFQEQSNMQAPDCQFSDADRNSSSSPRSFSSPFSEEAVINNSDHVHPSFLATPHIAFLWNQPPAVPAPVNPKKLIRSVRINTPVAATTPVVPCELLHKSRRRKIEHFVSEDPSLQVQYLRSKAANRLALNVQDINLASLKVNVLDENGGQILCQEHPGSMMRLKLKETLAASRLFRECTCPIIVGNKKKPRRFLEYVWTDSHGAQHTKKFIIDWNHPVKLTKKQKN